MKEEHTQKLDKQYLTQQEVADIFRVTPNTVRNWRKAGLLDFFQVPCSTRVLYPAQSVERFREQHSNSATINPIKKRKELKILAGQELSSNRIKKQDWRI